MRQHTIFNGGKILRNFTTQQFKSRWMSTIGVAGVTIPGALDCINKINIFAQGHFPKYAHPNIILHQLDFSETHEAQELNRWDIVEDRLIHSINSLAKMGADFVIIPANTVHKVIHNIQRKTETPVLNMLDLVAEECSRLKLTNVGILGTRWTMSMQLYHTYLKTRGIKETIPTAEDQEFIQKVIFSELVPTGRIKSETFPLLLEVVNRIKSTGCDGVVLACTELPLVLNTDNCGLITIDTTSILAKKSIERSIELIEKPKDDKSNENNFLFRLISICKHINSLYRSKIIKK